MDGALQCCSELMSSELDNARLENIRLAAANAALVLEVEELRRKLQERKVDESQPDSEKVFSALRDAAVSITYCNSELRYVWGTHFLRGFTWKFMRGKQDAELYPVDTKGLEDFVLLRRQALESGRLQMDYVQMDVPDHGSMTWLVMVKPCLDRDKNPVGVLTTCLNIPLAGRDSQIGVRNRTTEYELREAVRLTEEAIRAKNMFLSIMSHEIRTPLNGLLGMAEALESSGLTKDQRELLTAIVSSGTIITDILGDILDLASMESGAVQLEAQPFDPANVVHEVVKMAVAATHEKGLDILAQVGSTVPQLVIGDGLRVRQVMKYLVLNAIKFTHQGHVKIRLDSIPMLETPRPQPLSNKDDRQSEGDFLLWCQIADTGLGVPKEAFVTLFEHFRGADFSTTVNHGGTGLGLALCKQLVELMGGRLTADSEVGVGSVFTFTVLCKSHDIDLSDSSPLPNTVDSSNRRPATDNSAAAGPRSSSLTASRRKEQPRILLAEDNKVNVMVAISMLKRLGFTAQVVANGVEALEAMRKEKYDLVLLDICMPLMDGLQVAYAIRRFEETGSWPEEIWEDVAKEQHYCQAHEHRVQQRKQEDSEDDREMKSSCKKNVGQRIPIIAVTANALRSDIERCFAHGMDAFIPKPVMFQKLREILSKYLPIQ